MALVAVCAAACTDLSPIDAGICGNHIVEDASGEDCDGQDNCHAPETQAACRFSCSAEVYCPTGFGCGADAVCRRASGEFRPVSEVSQAALSLQAADFDGDGRDDLLRAGWSTTSVQYFDAKLSPAAEFRIEREPGDVPPLIGELSGDGSPDLALNLSFGADFGSGLAVYRSRPDHTLAPKLYSAVRFPQVDSDGAWTFALDIGGPEEPGKPDGVDEMLAVADLRLGQLNSTRILLVGQVSGWEPESESDPLGFSADSLAGGVVGSFNDAVDSPCKELALAGDAAASIQIHEFCESAASPTQLALPAGAKARAMGHQPQLDGAPRNLNSALLSTDLDGDGAVDLLIWTDYAAAPLHLAAGVKGAGLSAIVALDTSTALLPGDVPNPYLHMLAGCEDEGGPRSDTVPLAFADFDGDTRADVVTDDGVWLSSTRSHARCYAGWQSAVVADFNGDGHLDIVASRWGAPNLDLLIGDGTGVFTPFVVPTQRPVDYLVSGDFDGDGMADLGFSEFVDEALGGTADAAQQPLLVAFGRRSGGFDDPTVLGDLRKVRHLVAGRFLGDDGASDMVAISRPLKSSPDATEDVVAAALISGNGRRQLVAPYAFFHRRTLSNGVSEAERTMAELQSMVLGRVPNGGAPEPRLMVQTAASFAEFAPEAQELWQVAVAEDAALSVVGNALSMEKLGCCNCVLAPIDLDGDGADEGVFLGNDAVAIVSTGGETGATEGWVPKQYGGAQFSTIFAPPDEGVVSESEADEYVVWDSNGAFQRDVDADGLDDLIILSNTDKSGQCGYADPAAQVELVVFYNRGDGSLAWSESVRIALPPASADLRQTIRAFALVNADADPQLELVVSMLSQAKDGEPIAELRLFEVSRAGGVVGFEEGRLLDLPLTHPPEEMVAADFDGDGVDDLALGNAEGYAILKGLTVRP